MPSNIRNYTKNDYNAMHYLCSAFCSELKPNETKAAQLLYCDYYIDVEPELCFVATDEFDKPCGYLVASKSYSLYRREIEKYLDKAKKSSRKIYNRKNAEIYAVDIDIEEQFPSHFYMYILPSFRNKGYGRYLIEEYIKKLKSYKKDGISIVINKHDSSSIAFLERLGFIKNKQVRSKYIIYTYKFV